jgi:hypothetical protein
MNARVYTRLIGSRLVRDRIDVPRTQTSRSLLVKKLVLRRPPENCDKYLKFTFVSRKGASPKIPRVSYQSPVEIVGSIVAVAALAVTAPTWSGHVPRAKRFRWYTYFLTGHEKKRVRTAASRPASHGSNDIVFLLKVDPVRVVVQL